MFDKWSCPGDFDADFPSVNHEDFINIIKNAFSYLDGIKYEQNEELTSKRDKIADALFVVEVRRRVNSLKQQLNRLAEGDVDREVLMKDPDTRWKSKLEKDRNTELVQLVHAMHRFHIDCSRMID